MANYNHFLHESDTTRKRPLYSIPPVPNATQTLFSRRKGRLKTKTINIHDSTFSTEIPAISPTIQQQHALENTQTVPSLQSSSPPRYFGNTYSDAGGFTSDPVDPSEQCNHPSAELETNLNTGNRDSDDHESAANAKRTRVH